MKDNDLGLDYTFIAFINETSNFVHFIFIGLNVGTLFEWVGLAWDKQ